MSIYRVAADKLIAAMIEAEVPKEKITCVPSERGEGHEVRIEGGYCVHVTDYWAHPGIASYFVNWSALQESVKGKGHNFCMGAGTPSLMKAMMDLGQMTEMNTRAQFSAGLETANAWGWGV
jgi:hypothetical protein